MKNENKEIKPGEWINSDNYGESVCTEVEGEWIKLRYEAIRNSDGKAIWLGNAEHKNHVAFLREQDDVSQYVLTLKGPYGENRVNNKKNKP